MSNSETVTVLVRVLVHNFVQRAHFKVIMSIWNMINYVSVVFQRTRNHFNLFLSGSMTGPTKEPSAKIHCLDPDAFGKSGTNSNHSRDFRKLDFHLPLPKHVSSLIGHFYNNCHYYIIIIINIIL